MSDYNFFPVEIPAEDAKQGISTGFAAAKAAGILMGDGQGGIRTATPGADYGFPLLQGNGPPAGATVASLGQHYFDMTATKPPYEYVCVGYTAFGFVWTVYGDTGAGFQILGRFSTLEALEAAVAAGLVPKPSPGAAYFIGDVAPYDMYFWNFMTQKWAYYGPLGGAGVEDLVGIPPHGDAGQVLKKLSDADYDVGWGEAVPDGSITAAKIAPGAVGTTQLDDEAVTAEIIADEAVSKSLTVTLTVAGWSNNQQTVTASGATATNTVFASPAPASYLAFVKALVRCVEQAANSLTFQCEKVPTAALTVNVTLINK